MMKDLKLYYRLELRDPKGRMVRRTGLIRSHSYVLQFLKLVQGFMLDRATQNAKDITGASSIIFRVDTSGSSQGRIDGGNGDLNKGIVVGINSTPTPEANDNYKLDAIINHGTGSPAPAGTLNYQTCVFVAPSVVGANVDLVVARPFINETIAIITVKEIGIYCRNSFDNKTHCILRDVVADFNVDVGYTLTVIYVLRSTV